MNSVEPSATNGLGLARFWPRSLRGQVLLAIALALFLAQGIGAMLLYRAEHERIEGALIHSAAFRLAVATRGEFTPPHGPGFGPGPGGPERLRGGRVLVGAEPALLTADRREPAEEAELRRILAEQDLWVADARVYHRPVPADPDSSAQLMHGGNSADDNRDERRLAGE